MPISTKNAPAAPEQGLPAPAAGGDARQTAPSGHAHHLRPYVVVFDNLLSDQVCDELIGEFSASDEWQPAMVGDRVVEPDIRRVDVIEVSRRSVIERNPGVRRRLEQALYTAALGAVRRYEGLFPHCRIVEGHPFELLRYRAGGFYRTHTDSFKRVPRSLSCSFTLNDDYDGGEWSFFGGAWTVRPAKGSILLFPSSFMFPHEICEVTRGTRYSVVTWMI